jgi:hypothetical protein
MIAPPVLPVECWLARAKTFEREVRHITDSGLPSCRARDSFGY